MMLLDKKYKHPKTALNYKTSHELLVATILSAQCTDKRVNEVTKDLFKKYKRAKDYAQTSAEEFEKDIRTTGFFRNKAKNIVESSKIIVKKFQSRVPDSMEKLITLPGVARKTANMVLSEVFQKKTKALPLILMSPDFLVVLSLSMIAIYVIWLGNTMSLLVVAIIIFIVAIIAIIIIKLKMILLLRKNKKQLASI